LHRPDPPCLPAQRAAGYGGISLVQMKGSDSDWMGMNNKYGEAWEVPVTPHLPWCGPCRSRARLPNA